MSIKNILKSLVPTQNNYVYSLCKRYVDRYNNENNDDMGSNGELRLMREQLPQCSVAFDVGANIGEWAGLAMDINAGMQIHCFEPSPRTFQHLAERNIPGHVVRNNIGLSSSPREATLHVFEDGGGINSLYRRAGLEDGWGLKPQSREEKIRLDTLDAYCRQNNVCEIDFLKIDVEGHELEVFRGGEEMFNGRKIKRIQFEYGGCNIDSRVLLKDLFEYLSARGYRLYKVFPSRLSYVARYDQRLENFQYQNWFAVSPEFNEGVL